MHFTEFQNSSRYKQRPSIFENHLAWRECSFARIVCSGLRGLSRTVEAVVNFGVLVEFVVLNFGGIVGVAGSLECSGVGQEAVVAEVSMKKLLRWVAQVVAAVAAE